MCLNFLWCEMGYSLELSHKIFRRTKKDQNPKQNKRVKPLQDIGRYSVLNNISFCFCFFLCSSMERNLQSIFLNNSVAWINIVFTFPRVLNLLFPDRCWSVVERTSTVRSYKLTSVILVIGPSHLANM